MVGEGWKKLENSSNTSDSDSDSVKPNDATGALLGVRGTSAEEEEESGGGVTRPSAILCWSRVVGGRGGGGGGLAGVGGGGRGWGGGAGVGGGGREKNVTRPFDHPKKIAPTTRHHSPLLSSLSVVARWRGWGGWGAGGEEDRRPRSMGRGEWSGGRGRKMRGGGRARAVACFFSLSKKLAKPPVRLFRSASRHSHPPTRG